MRLILLLPVYVCLSKTPGWSWNGSYMHSYEIGLLLREMGVSVTSIFRCEEDSIVFKKKYKNPLRYILYDEDIPHPHILLSYKFFYINRRTCKKLIHITTDFEKDKWELYLTYYPHLINDTYLLTASNVESTLCEIPPSILSFLKTPILYTWGILGSHMILDPNYKNKKWLLYSRRDKDMSSEDTVKEAINWGAEHNIIVDIDPQFVNAPYLQYDGLLYTKHIDYSGRSPFEFALAGKPIVPFVWPENMQRLTSDKIQLRKKHIIQDIPVLSLPEEILEIL